MYTEQSVNVDITEAHVHEGKDDLLSLQGPSSHRSPLLLKEALSQICPALWFLNIIFGFNIGFLKAPSTGGHGPSTKQRSSHPLLCSMKSLPSNTGPGEGDEAVPTKGPQRARPGYGGAPLAGEVASGARAPRGGGRGRGAPTRRCRWARGALPRQRACSAPAPGRRPPRPGASQAGVGAARPADGLRRPAARERGSGAMPELRGAGEVGAWLRARLSAGCLKSAGIVYASWLTRARARFFRCGHQNSDPQRWRENYFTVKTVAIQ